MMVALLFLVAAVAIGIHFADPARGADQPAGRRPPNRSARGDLAARVPEGEKDDELASLSRAFNRMTYQIESQQRELEDANRQLDERRRFTETVLTGVSGGVIGLDRVGRVNLPNRSASALLGVDLEQSIGEDLAEVAPEMAGLLDEAARRPDGSPSRRSSSSAAPAPAPCWCASPPSMMAREISGYRRDLRRHHRAVVGAAQGGSGPTSPAASRTKSRTR